MICLPSTFKFRPVMSATVTPLASILGSGLLIIVPVLEGTLGRLAIFGVIAVCALAWWVGTAVRHIIQVVEPLHESGKLDATTSRLDRLGDGVIVIAYVISVALYLRIMAKYVFDYAGFGGTLAEKLLACADVALIVVVGIVRGFAGLERLDEFTVGAVLVLTTVLGGTLLFNDGGDLVGDGLTLPPVPDVGLAQILLVLGGIVITVQGFETVRYLKDEYDAVTRVWASRVAQLVAAFIYIGFVAVATPFMGLGTDDGADATLLDITARAAPWLALPLVLSAVLSQFSASVADTAAADGNLRTLVSWMTGVRPFLISGVAAIALAATVETLTIVAVASRAFAAYYAVQAVIAFRTADRTSAKVSYATLAVLMVAITLLAKPAA